MYIKRLTRRNFFRFASHSMIAGALSRTFIATEAFGQTGRLKLFICTTPNGHLTSSATRDAISAAMTPQLLQNYGLFLEGMDFAATVNDAGQGIGDWHGGESALLCFNNFKGSGPSFYTALQNINKVYLDVDVGDRVYARDSSGGQVASISNPAAAMASAFGQSLQTINSVDTYQIKTGKKHILDPCLEDIKMLKNRLGSDGAMFDDYLYALQESYRNLQTAQPTPGSGGTGQRVEAQSCDKAANISPGNNIDERHSAMLEVGFHLMACDAAQVIVLSFLNNNTDPQHQFIHGDGSNDGGARFKGFTDTSQARIASLANRLPIEVLDRSAMVYISEGGSHFENGSFNNQHPQKNIPCAIFGKLGGAINRTGITAVNGQTNRNLWRTLADALAGGNADLNSIGGAGVSPMNLI